MDEARALLRQAESDLAAADRMYDSAGAGTYCQAVAKYQQATEKAIKALVAALRFHGVNLPGTRLWHDPSEAMSGIARWVNPSTARRQNDIYRRISTVFSSHRRAEIRTVCGLAPTRPDRGESFARNTEYPYQDVDGRWRAPADEGTFAREEVEGFRRLAAYLADQLSEIISALRRGAS